MLASDIIVHVKTDCRSAKASSLVSIVVFLVRFPLDNPMGLYKRRFAYRQSD
jgi:hypothetical protein